MKNRLILTLPLFALVVVISIWNFADEHNFNILWRWFAWSNQVLACIALWVATAYLLKERPHQRFLSLFTALPATLLTMVVTTYIFAEPRIALGRFVPYNIACIIGTCISVVVLGTYLFHLFFRKQNVVQTVETTEKTEAMQTEEIQQIGDASKAEEPQQAKDNPKTEEAPQTEEPHSEEK